MPRVCSAVGCRSFEGSGVSLHRFPTDKDRRKQWLVNMNRGESWQPTRAAILCWEHFEKSCFTDATHLSASFGIPMRPKLKPDAVPTIFDHRKCPKPTDRSERRRKRALSFECKTCASSAVSPDAVASSSGIGSCFCAATMKRPQQGRQAESLVKDDDKGPLHYSTSDGTRTESPENNGLVVQPNRPISCIKQTAMDRPYVCQRCSATFLLASSLRTHAAHIHGEGLPSLLAESGCHPSRVIHGDRAVHGDAACDIKPDMIKIEVCEEESIQNNTLESEIQRHSSEVHGESVTDAHSGTLDNTADDIKLDMIKLEVCDTDSVESNMFVADNPTHVSDVHCKKLTNSHSGTLDDTADDLKPDMIKLEICELEKEQSNIVVTDSQTLDSDVHGNNVYDSYSGTLDDTDDAIQPDVDKLKNCYVDSLESSLFVADNQTHVDNNLLDYGIVINNGWLHLVSPKCELPQLKPFNSRTRRKYSHQRHASVGPSPYCCSVCKKTFDRACSFWNHRHHVPIHTSDRPYVCTVSKNILTSIIPMTI